MAITQFIPTVWSETLYRQLDKEYIAVKNCSREFEGDIKNMGDTVKIIGLNPINVFDYTKNTDMSAPGELSDNVRMLTVNRAKAFNFVIDDIEAAQTSPVIMKEAMRVAASCGVRICDCYQKWKRLEACGVDTTSLLANHINHPIREMHWMIAHALIDIIFSK